MNTIAASTRRVPRAALIGIVVLIAAFAALMVLVVPGLLAAVSFLSLALGPWLVAHDFDAIDPWIEIKPEGATDE